MLFSRRDVTPCTILTDLIRNKRTKKRNGGRLLAIKGNDSSILISQHFPPLWGSRSRLLSLPSINSVVKRFFFFPPSSSLHQIPRIIIDVYDANCANYRTRERERRRRDVAALERVFHSSLLQAEESNSTLCVPQGIRINLSGCKQIVGG